MRGIVLGALAQAFDKDNSGTISFAELSDGLKNLSLGRKGGQTVRPCVNAWECAAAA